MAVTDEPLYKEWVEASDRLNEAIARMHLAEKTGSDGLITLARQDMNEAQAAYDVIAKKV